ncbi:hypothetical protein [Desulfonatronum thioautotrophicum]|uniref:hypothetical protein n=1 Tax=Desulfonatronum thioautotrophicum TaxID=617001 RepID=UPI0005EBA049|nr:hypothetical protein [Desulfonatronum thioautotrophicum]
MHGLLGSHGITRATGTSGLSPLAEVRPCVTDNAIFRAIVRINFAYGESMYPFQGIDFHKRAYHLEPQSIRKPVYCITKGRAPIMDIIRTFEVVGSIPPGNPLAPLGHVARGVVRRMVRSIRVVSVSSRRGFP